MVACFQRLPDGEYQAVADVPERACAAAPTTTATFDPVQTAAADCARTPGCGSKVTAVLQLDPSPLVQPTAGPAGDCVPALPAAIQVDPSRPTAVAPGGPGTAATTGPGLVAGPAQVIPSEVDSETVETFAFPIACGEAETLTVRTSLPATCCNPAASSMGPTGPKVEGFALGSFQVDPLRTNRCASPGSLSPTATAEPLEETIVARQPVEEAACSGSAIRVHRMPSVDFHASCTELLPPTAKSSDVPASVGTAVIARTTPPTVPS